MILQSSVVLYCSYCNAEIERHTRQEAHDALIEHQQYVQCLTGY